MKKKNEFWLYHPSLNIPERGYTGRYRPAGLTYDGVEQIEIEVVLFKGQAPVTLSTPTGGKRELK